MLRIGLEMADRVVAALPSRVAFALADLAGDAWYRLAPARRRLVAANLERVCAATGRPAGGRPFATMVRAAFRNHARYYVELLRTPHYDRGRIDEVVSVPEWERFAEVLGAGPCVLMSSHLGNFEPFGVFLAARGIRPLSPIEEIQPPALFDFLSSRRGGGGVELVPLRRAGTALRRQLRAGGVVGIIGDRVIEGGASQSVTVFGHPTRVPLGPATLVVTHAAGLIVGRCLRTGPDRFEVDGEVIAVPNSGDRRADIAALAGRLAARFESDIAAAPEQWWGAFQPYWPDLPA